MKKENSKKVSKKSVQSESDFVDVHNDALMVALGIRHDILDPRDENVWVKTPNEKRILKNAKHSSREDDDHFSVIPNQFIPVWGKLVIYLKKNNKYPKTTYSTECWQNDIASILSKYQAYNKKTESSSSVILKYSWNGKTYKLGTLPFWK